MPAITTCPDSATLQQLLRGETSADAIESFAEHVAGCTHCAGAVENSLAGDTLVEAVRAQATPSDTRDAPAALMVRLLRLGRPPTPDATPGGETVTLTPAAVPVDAPAESLTFLAPPQAADEIGRLGGYRVLKVIGAGGMGLVFQAEDVHLKRKVALKVMKPEAAVKPGARERFLREAQAAAAVEHEHIVTIHQVGDERGVPFLAMQWLKGMSLEERLQKSGALKPAQVMRLGRQIALGLAAAHEHGLIHRDIKPANLWLEPTHGGHVKILDFGLARALADEVHLTQSGAILGTPAYMAPEQARGDKVDHRCDLFSLGVVLYRLATGRLPFRGANTMATLTSLALDTPAPPRALNADVPAELSELIVQLLEKDPARRPPAARAVAERLQRLGPPPAALSAEPERTEELSAARAPIAPAAAPRPATRLPRRWLPIAAAAGLAAAVLLAAGAVFFLRTPNGTVRVEINDDSLEAVLTKNGAVIKGTDKAGDITVAAGRQTLTVRRGDLEFETKQFVLKKGDTVRLKVELLPGKVQVVQGNQVIGAQALPVAGDPDRRAAEYVLSIGGTVRVNGQERDLRAAAELPKNRFTLTWVNLNGNKQVGDAGLAHFKDCKGLMELGLGGTQVSDVGLAYFKDCKGLTYLGLNSTQVSDTGLAHFHGCKSLTQLVLSNTQVSDAGLAHFQSCKGLTHLLLHGTQVSDAGLAQFKDCKGLTQLDVRKTPATAKALAGFHAAVPGCRIEHDGGIIEAAAEPDRRAAEYVLSIGGTVRVNGQEGDLRAAAELPKDRFTLTRVNLNSNTQVSDAGLAPFKDCKGLTQLSLYGTQVGDAGMAHFKDCKGLTVLLLNSTQVSDAGLAHFEGCKGLTSLDLAHTRVSDAGLAYFQDCKRLTQLVLTSTKVSDAGLAYFQGCKDLTQLIVNSTKVSNAGLAYFQGCKDLTQLIVNSTKVSDAGLAHFKDCKGLTHLNLGETQVSDVGLAYLKGCKSLQHLDLGGTQVSDAGLAYFQDCKGLTGLSLRGTQVSNAGLVHFQGCNSLTYLGLGGTKVSDVGLTHFKGCKSLAFLGLGGTKVSDAGLVHFHDCKALTQLDVRKTQVTAKALAVFHAAVPGCRIEHDGGIIQAAAEPDRRAAEYVLSIGGTVRVNDQERDLRAAAELPKDRFTLTRVNLNSNTQVSDAGLAPFKDCKGLTQLELGGTKVSDAGLAYFQGCKDLTVLLLNSTQVSDAGLVHFQGCRSLTVLGFGGAPVSDAGLAHLKGCKRLTDLHLAHTRVGDAGLAHLKDCKSLTHLHLNGTQVSDAGLAHFQGGKGLMQLGLGGTQVSDAGLAHLKCCKSLTHLHLNGTQVSDAGLAHFHDCKGLTQLDVRKTPVTAKALAGFHTAVPACRIEHDGGVIEAKK